ncbi:glycosyl hydrolase [Candidatus Weimeria sp. HCP3S3_B5]|uniref:glycosyl hydrolase n=1 Tax=Candidatus Weimeria sp. HCP3S3_B5 TaxID=3438871 RepID=UPI003F88966B
MKREMVTMLLAGAMVLGSVQCLPVTVSAKETTLASFDFNKGIDGWYYGKGWEYQYDSGSSTTVDADCGALRMNVDFSKNSDSDWSQTTAVYETKNPMNLTGATKASLDLIYDARQMTGGNLGVKLYTDEGLSATATADLTKAETVSGDKKKVHLAFSFDALDGKSKAVKKFAIQLVGIKTAYKGSVWIDNVTIISDSSADKDVVSTKKIKKQKAVDLNSLKLPVTIKTVDPKATNDVKNTYAYLQAIGRSQKMIFGHQNEYWDKAGSSKLSSSDTKDVTGSYAGVMGIDGLSLVGDEYSAAKWNKTHKAKIREDQAGNVKAAAAISNEAIKNGSIVTLSAHMPNFGIVKKKGNSYDYSGYTPNNMEKDPANNILPGGKYNKQFRGYLDLIASYAKQVNGTVLFRPFHENTGSWFWWGAAYCDRETYKNIYRYTVTYLTKTKDVHNMLFVYSPGSEPGSVEEFEERYPGDAYVDMVGFDMYDRTHDDAFIANFRKQVKITDDFAKKHGKLFAVTETGVANDAEAGDSQTALLKKGNEKDWYNKILNAAKDSSASYFLLWADFSKTNGFYIPYVDKVNKNGTLKGHELLDDFISFYNSADSVFASDQKSALKKLSSNAKIKAAVSGSTGFITAPLSGNRILGKTTLAALVPSLKKTDKVTFVVKSGEKSTTLKARKDGNTYSAVLSVDQLKKLDAGIGTISLMTGKKIQQSIEVILNIPAPVENPLSVDGFEDYLGYDARLTNAWTTNKDSGCNIKLSLVKDAFDGYSMKMDYDETAKGWAGATINKIADWSSCDSLSFDIAPDGKNQKTVVQVTAGGNVYEAYLNTYTDYASAGTDKLHIVIPFSDFVARDVSGNPKGGLVKDSSKISSVGLWVNAIGDSSAVKDGKVSGSLIYDNIMAEKTNAKAAVFTKK